jgi:hypothetical protein
VNRGGGDYLNLAYEKRIAGKVDYYVQQDVAYNVTVQPSGGITSTYRLTLQNQTPPGQPGMIAGFAKPYAVDLAMLNLYVPKRGRVLGVTPRGDFPPDVITPSRFSDHVNPKGFLQHDEGDFKVLTQTILAWPGHPGTLTYRYTVPGVIQQTPEGRVYALTVQHQALARPQTLTVRVTLPSDANVTTLGPGWVLAGNVATYHATLTRDFVTKIVF